jgi:hypothetical protein
MLKKIINIVILTSLWLCYPELGFTVEHPPGHGGGSGGARGCQKVGVRNIKPAPLSEVAAGSQFSAMVIGAAYPEDIEVTVKKMPISAEIVKKEDFYLVTGQLPDDIHATAARINIKIKGKVASCTEESGWLLKVTN